MSSQTGLQPRRRAIVFEPALDVTRRLQSFAAEAGWEIDRLPPVVPDHLDGAVHLLIVPDEEAGWQDLVRALRRQNRALPIVVVGTEDSARAATVALRAGATDYEVVASDLPARVLGAADDPLACRDAAPIRTSSAESFLASWLKRGGRCDDAICAVIGPGPESLELFRRIERAAQNDANVLITGETGVGKEIVARTIHRMSPRAERPFTEQNCAALPEQLLESELFGYRKGTFTGATQDRRGLIEATAGGTLFLDEIGEASLPVQAKLLRFIETKTVRPLGDVTARRVDVRIVAATNRDLAADAAVKAFREDLYYRLNVLTIRLPPLRERRQDIPRLVTCLVNCGAGRGEPLVIEDDALAALMAYNWPGNLRELHNAALHAIAMRGERRISVFDLPEHVLDGANRAHHARPGNPTGDAGASAGSTNGAPRLRAGEVSREWIEGALARAGGNRTVAARLAGLSRSSFYYNLKKFGLE